MWKFFLMGRKAEKERERDASRRPNTHLPSMVSRTGPLTHRPFSPSMSTVVPACTVTPSWQQPQHTKHDRQRHGHAMQRCPSSRWIVNSTGIRLYVSRSADCFCPPVRRDQSLRSSCDRCAKSEFTLSPGTGTYWRTSSLNGWLGLQQQRLQSLDTCRARVGGGDMGQKIVNGFPFLYKRHRTSSARRTSIMESVLSPA